METVLFPGPFLQIPDLLQKPNEPIIVLCAMYVCEFPPGTGHLCLKSSCASFVVPAFNVPPFVASIATVSHFAVSHDNDAFVDIPLDDNDDDVIVDPPQDQADDFFADEQDGETTHIMTRCVFKRRLLRIFKKCLKLTNLNEASESFVAQRDELVAVSGAEETAWCTVLLAR